MPAALQSCRWPEQGSSMVRMSSLSALKGDLGCMKAPSCFTCCRPERSQCDAYRFVGSIVKRCSQGPFNGAGSRYYVAVCLSQDLRVCVVVGEVDLQQVWFHRRWHQLRAAATDQQARPDAAGSQLQKPNSHLHEVAQGKIVSPESRRRSSGMYRRKEQGTGSRLQN